MAIFNELGLGEWIAIGLLLLFTLCALIAATVLNKRDKRSLSIYALTMKRDASLEVSYKIYKFLEKIPLAKRAVSRIVNRYRVLFPGYNKAPYEKAVTLFFTYVIVTLASGGMLGFFIPYTVGVPVTPFVVCTSLFCAFVICKKISVTEQIKMETDFLEAFDDFLTKLVFEYYRSHSVRTALGEIVTQVKPCMRGHVTKLLDVMSSASPSEDADKYMHAGYHEYLGLFLSMALQNDESGVSARDENPPFLDSVARLQRDVHEDQLTLMIRKDKFTGRDLIAGLVVVFLPYFAQWGVSNAPSMLFGYRGQFGTLLEFTSLMITYAVFMGVEFLYALKHMGKGTKPLAAILSETKPLSILVNAIMKLDRKNAEKNEHHIKELMELYGVRTLYTGKVLCFFFVLFVSAGAMAYGQNTARELARTDVTQIADRASNLDSRQLDVLMEAVPALVCEYSDAGVYVTEEMVRERISMITGVRTEECVKVGTELVCERVRLIERQEFSILQAVIALAMACCGYCYPTVVLWFKKKRSASRKRDEVKHFESLICMLKDSPGMTSLSLLETMEKFSDVLKRPVRSCINLYNSNPREAYENLIKEADCPEMTRLVECFMQVEEISLKHAFANIAAEMDRNRDKRREETNKQIEHAAKEATGFAVIPGTFAVAYMVLPFAVSVAMKLVDIKELIESFKFLEV